MATTPFSAGAGMQDALTSFVLMHRANALLTAALAQRHSCSISDMRALVFVAGGGDTTPGAIGRELGLSSGAITTLVDRLDAAGWAQRVPNPNDRRSSYLELLPEGQAVLDEVGQIYRAAFQDAVASGVSFDCLTSAFRSVGDALRSVGEPDSAVA